MTRVGGMPQDPGPDRTPDILLRKRQAREVKCVRRCREGRTGGTDTTYRDKPRVALMRDILRFLGLYERGVRNANNLRLRSYTLNIESLPPAFDGFRVLQLSDFHFGYDLEIAARTGSLIKDVRADLCVMTGDYRFNHWAPCRHVYAGIETVLRSLECRHGVVGILGNNDMSDFLDGFRRLGIRMLVNESTSFAIDGDAIHVAGVDDPHEFKSDSLYHALQEVPEGAFTMLLAHSPELIPEAADAGVDLYLCGHTHGGQVCFPWIGPVYINARCSRKYAVPGVWRYEGLQGITNAGVGSSTLPIRFNCPPEVVVIELRRAR